jgi:hypothetical protein
LWSHGAEVANAVTNLLPIRPRFRKGSGARHDGGLYENVQRAIALGCLLVRLMGVLYLKLLDEGMAATGLAYARFMDDWMILAPTRWKLWAAIRYWPLPPLIPVVATSSIGKADDGRDPRQHEG